MTVLAIAELMFVVIEYLALQPVMLSRDFLDFPLGQIMTRRSGFARF